MPTRKKQPMSNQQPQPEAFGVFQHPKDASWTHTALTVDDANRLRFEGWREVQPPEPQNDWQANAADEQSTADEQTGQPEQ